MQVKGPSLNECLYQGPNLNPLLFDILLRFRVLNIRLSADITSEERGYMRFLWYDDINKCNLKVEKLRFSRVFFGARSSQFLLNGVLQIHVGKYRDIHPEVVDQLSRHLYVDDLNSAMDTVTDGIEIYHKIKSIFKEGNFILRKWKKQKVGITEIFN